MCQRVSAVLSLNYSCELLWLLYVLSTLSSVWLACTTSTHAMLLCHAEQHEVEHTLNWFVRALGYIETKRVRGSSRLRQLAGGFLAPKGVPVLYSM